MNKKAFSVDILKYWYFLEFMSQADFPYQEKAERAECNKAKTGQSKRRQITVFETLRSDKLLCEHHRNQSVPISIAEVINRQGSNFKSHPIVSDEVGLCIGKINREVFAKSLECLSDKKLNSPEKKYNTVGLVGLKCNQDGIYIPGSLNISPLAWGTNRLITHQEITDYTALLSTEAYHTDMKQLETLLINGANSTGEQLTGELIQKLIVLIHQKYLVAILGPFDSSIWDGVLIVRRYDTEDSKAEDNELYSESELSRSFFSEDLLMVTESLANRELDNSAMQTKLHSNLLNKSEKAIFVFNRFSHL